ncbi:MAG: hypothetical protein ISR82_00190 [Candidatus Marinimicrobia bacterium]|nr:hypothetical protein [Candidatus Neomarinimicrobiota bacterium]MBL7009622.1 hypothetical protein [Candidatus Neomarinimicrobiota bacterium]MBL7029635.1 hypothetical protein [Candidatus Neomarinimicrobiota bacterium]
MNKIKVFQKAAILGSALFIMILSYFVGTNPLVIQYHIIGWNKLPSDNSNIIYQQTHSDCGPAALANIFQHYDIPFNLSNIAEEAGTDSIGTSLKALKRIAIKKGLNAEGWKYNWKDFNSSQKPVIAFINGNHFVMIEKSNDETVVMVDPSRGRLKMKAEKFKRIWQGETLQIARAEPNDPARIKAE